MTDQSLTAVESAIQNLQARQPKPRGRRQELAPYVDQLRALIAAGWTRAEIIAEVKALGSKMSPALLRDALQLPPAKPSKAKQTKTAKPNASASPALAAPRPVATAPYDQDQPAAE
jgi:hypothetical protein